MPMIEPRVKILMVDDRPENLLAIEAILEPLGLDLVRAESGEEALKAVLRHDFALILMDVQMPGMNGFDTASVIKERERSRHIPIIFLTAISTEERYVFEGYAVGAVDYLFKPFQPAILRSKVAVFVDLHRKTTLLKQVEARERQTALAQQAAEQTVRYRKLADALPQIVITASPDGSVTYLNQRWWDYTGMAPETDINDQIWTAVLHPDDVSAFFARRARMVEGGAPESGEYRLRRADGIYRWHLLQTMSEGLELGWVGTFTDVDARIVERRAAEHLMARLIDTAPAGIAFVDAGQVVRSANPEFARFVGAPAATLLGRPATDALDGHASAVVVALDAVQKSGEPQRLTGYAGEAWDVMVVPVAADGGSAGMLIFALDVVDRLENERLQHDQIAHLRQVDTLKDEFLSVISHELRTPLNFIMGFASILDDEIAGPLIPAQHAYLDKILRGTDRMLLLVNDLLDFAKLQAGEVELATTPIGYAPLVEEVLAALQPLADQKHITLSMALDPELVASCDPERVIQVLTNLVGNAIKFTPENGTVRVTAALREGEIFTEVEDSGIGIAADDLGKLFTRFRQLDMSRTRAAGGTGLGLSITKALVEAHGGRITVTSPGQGLGACFCFTLRASLLNPTSRRESVTPAQNA